LALDHLARILAHLSPKADRRATLEAALAAALEPLALTRGAILLRVGSGDDFEVKASRGLSAAGSAGKPDEAFSHIAAQLARQALAGDNAVAVGTLAGGKGAHVAEAKGAAAAPIAFGPRRLGAIVAFSEHARPFTDDELAHLKMAGALLGCTFAAQDMMQDVEGLSAEVKTLTGALEERTSTLKELDRYKTRSIHLITHELRKPLTPIFTYSDMLLGLEFPPEKQRKFLEQIRASAGEMNEYITAMIEAAKLEEGEIQLLFSDADIAAMLASAAEAWRKQAKAAGVSLEVKVELPRPTFTTDAQKIGEILENLVENAVKYTAEGGRVVVGARHDGTDLIFEVKDTGIGIPAAEIPDLFQKFNIVKKAAVPRPAHRTGLGLYLARVLTEALGGTIKVDSELGKGSTFTVRIPVGA